MIRRFVSTNGGQVNRLCRTSITLLFAFFFISGGLTAVPLSAIGEEGAPSPGPTGWSTTGDWTIEEGDNIEHSYPFPARITVNGNLTIEDGGKLTLNGGILTRLILQIRGNLTIEEGGELICNNVDLRMDLQEHGGNSIMVYGELGIYDGTRITPHNPERGYKFEVYNYIEAVNSTIQGIWGERPIFENITGANFSDENATWAGPIYENITTGNITDWGMEELYNLTDEMPGYVSVIMKETGGLVLKEQAEARFYGTVVRRCFSTAIYAQQGSTLELVNSSIINNKNVGVYLNGAVWEWDESNNVWVRRGNTLWVNNSIIEGNGFHGVGSFWYNNVFIQDSSISENVGINVVSDRSHITILNSTLSRGMVGFQAFGLSGFPDTGEYFILLKNNTIERNWMFGAFIENCLSGGVYLKNNTISFNHGTGVGVFRSGLDGGNVLLEDNTISQTRKSAPQNLDPYWDIAFGVSILPGNGILVGQSFLEVADNDIYMNQAAGIKVAPAILWKEDFEFDMRQNWVWVNDNNITDHFLGPGIYISTAPISGLTVTRYRMSGNYISNNEVGIFAYRDGDTLRFLSRDDELVSNRDAGIMINPMPAFSPFALNPGFGGRFELYNTIIDGGVYGIYARGTQELLIKNAEISNCGTGVGFFNQTLDERYDSLRVLESTISDCTTGINMEAGRDKSFIQDVEFINFTTGLLVRGPHSFPFNVREALIENCTFTNEMEDPDDDVVGTAVAMFRTSRVVLDNLAISNVFRGFDIENISGNMVPPKLFNTTFSSNTNTTIYMHNNGTIDVYALTLSRNRVRMDDEESQLRLYVYLDVKVLDSWGDPFEGATVKVVNPVTEKEVFIGQTPENGEIVGMPIVRNIWMQEEEEENDNDILYLNYSVSASSPQFSRERTIALEPFSKTRYQVTLELNTPPFVEKPIPIQYINRMVDGTTFLSSLHLNEYFGDHETPDDLRYTWSASVDYILLTVNPWTRVTYRVTNYWYGTANIVITASDGIDSVQQSYSLVVEYVNFGPHLKKNFPQISMEESTVYSGLDLNDYITHRDGKPLTFSAQVDTINVDIDPQGIVTIIPPAGWTGVRTVTFTATDDDGKTASGTMDVAVYATGPGPVFSVTITPSPAVSVETGEDLVFTAQAHDQFGVLISDNKGDFIWENATAGIFNMAVAGVYNVTARYEGVSSQPTVVTVEEVYIPPEDQYPTLVAPLPSFSGEKNTPMWEVLDLDEYFFHPTSNLSYTVSTSPEIEVLINNSIVSFIPASNWIGRRTLTFTAEAVDNGLTTNGLCTVTIREPTIPPALIYPLPDIELDQGENRNIDLSEHFTGTDLSFSFTQDGTLSISITAATMRITAPLQTWGMVGVTVKASSGIQFVSDHMNVTLLYENQPPVVSDVSVTVDEGKTASRIVRLADHVSDEKPSEQLTYIVIESPDLTATVDVDTYLTITPSHGYHGTTWLDIEVNDTELSSVMRVTVTVSPAPSPPNTPPTALIRFSESTNTIWVNQQVTLYGEDSWDEEGPIVNYLWDLGDGTTSSDTNPRHTYSQSGTYVCVLRVRDEKGLSDTQEFIVVVRNREPAITSTSHETGHIEISTGKTVHLWVEAWDPDGQALSYQWQLNGRNVGTRTSAYSFTPEEPGEYTITMTVSDGEETATQEWTVVVAEQETGLFNMGDALGGYLLHIIVLLGVIILTVYFLVKSKRHESVD